MKTILAAIDYSRAGAKVTAAAVRLGGLAGARIVLTHVVVPPVFDSDFVGLSIDRLAREATLASDRKLDRIRRRYMDAVSAIPTRIGPVVPLVLDLARKIHADVIVVGSHGHGAGYDLAVGSVSRGILRRARCPVLVVPVSRGRRSSRRRPAGNRALRR